MALLHNTYLRGALLGRFQGSMGNSLPAAGMSRPEKENWYSGDHTPDKKSGYVDGARHPASWFMAIKNGGMGSRNAAVMAFTPSAAGALGVNIDGATSFSFTFAPLDGQLIVSGSGSAALTFGATGNVLAMLNGTGSASIAFSTNTPLLGALGWSTASGQFSITGSLTPYAKGFMVGSTVDNTTLTAAAILAAMNAAPPAVNIKKVNDVTVTGTGSPGNEWGP